ncbi:hypothetical protein [Nonomuraea sp. NPDC049709]|uniref:hypothetical protein n=1 Tax=Nonomuraea sp. NPDC049709 TaxID=3154736 RepID=UPI00343B5362
MIEPPPVPDDDRYHSAHVPRPRPGFTRLRWERLREGSAARIRDYTCDCQNPYYELCSAGGQYFIRRTWLRNGTVQVHETARGRVAKAMEVWSKLLSGEAA